MNKIYYYIIASAIFVLMSGCNDEWKDELYTKMVSLKAPITNEGVSDIYLRYKVDGTMTYNLPVIVSGSKNNDENLDVFIGVDNDTLAILNEERYKTRYDLYFKQLSDNYFELPSHSCHIPAGSNVENFQIKFNISGLNLVERWVLPLTIQDNPNYVPNKRKGWRKALLYIHPFNDYSGKYSATAMNVYFGDETINPMVMDYRNAKVVDLNSIFFYAGAIEERAEDRGKYKIIVKFEEPNMIGEGSIKKKGSLVVQAENPDINFQLLSQPTYEIMEEMDAVQPYLLHRYFVLYMKYKYDDITSIEGHPLTYRAEGSMVMERKINTLIPDEDQAIIW